MQPTDMVFEDAPATEQTTKKLFGFESNLKPLAFREPHALTPALDATYHFDPATTKAILAGFMHNRRVLIQGYHGTGKSSHVEQIAARLNWPCIRINMDSHISRTDLIGRDAIVLQDGKQVTAFQEGIIPWALRRPIALVFDEYDAGRPDVMFVIQRILEAQGKLTLLDQNTVITPHPFFRIFATSNTIGLGDATGLYHGTQPINQGQMDRWNIVSTLNYLDHTVEESIITAKVKPLDNAKGKKLIAQMVAMAGLTRQGFMNGDISTVMSPRTVLSWAENTQILDDVDTAFRLSFLNKCDEMERPTIAEYYQRCFDVDLLEAAA
ncbi:MAG: cobaltochelatase subunit CobS [Azospirillum brasilense]|nr:MAG: cobaltochelatase subunit CobS [Azospirillum brasilense]